MEIVAGVRMGGFDAAKKAVREGRVDPKSIRWFTRYAGWSPRQLEAECAAGVWFTAAAGKGVILREEGEGVEKLWHEVLELMGGEYAGLSRAAKETSRADIMGQQGKEEGGNASDPPT